MTRCTDLAAVKVTEFTQLIHAALDDTTSCTDVTAPVVAVSQPECVDMDAARQTAAIVLSDEGLSSSSVAAVPAPTAIDSGNGAISLLQ